MMIFSIITGYSVLFFMDIVSEHHHITLCLFKKLTSIPCPGCGMGRATLELMKGNFMETFKINILCIPFNLIVFISLVWMLIDLLKKRETFFYFIQRDIKRPYNFLIFILIAFDWAINIINKV